MSMNEWIQKFPLVQLNETAQLVWDSRQEWKEGDSLFLRKFLSSEMKEKLSEEAHKKNMEVVSEEKLFSDYFKKAFQIDQKKIKIIGITGTNGKSSSLAMLRHLLSKQGKSVVELGTLGMTAWNKDGSQDFHFETGFTTPDTPMLYSVLNQAIKNNYDFLILEVTSHSLQLGRVEGIEFDAALFTNLSHDHLDFHKSFEDYQSVKYSLFLEHLPKQKEKKNPHSFINTENEYGRELTQKLDQKQISHSEIFSRNKELVELKNVPKGLSFQYADGSGCIPIHGEYQWDNFFLVASLLKNLLEIPFEKLLQDIQSLEALPGRMQKIVLKKEEVLLNFYIDYAHTPDSLEKALLSLKKLSTESKTKLFVVFGCGGGRDSLKRPMMGKIAQSIADTVILTTDNPRAENPQEIIEAIHNGTTKNENIYCEIDRSLALKKAYSLMKNGDHCLVSGKGHEKFQHFKDKKISFSDLEELQSLAEL